MKDEQPAEKTGRKWHVPLLVWIGLVVAALAVALHRVPKKPSENDLKGIQPPTTQSLAGGTALRGLATELYCDDPDTGFEKKLRELAAMRTQVVCISVRGVQEDVKASRVFIDSNRGTPNPRALVRIIRRARELGMQVVVLPIVLLWDVNASDDWRGIIEPRRWDRWWESYERFIVHYARLAQEGGAEVLCVGSELIRTEHMRDRWLDVIRAVRAVYAGKLTYSANWDHYREVTFWDALDLIGMTAYHRLTRDKAPTLDELRAAWKKIRAEILGWQREQGKRIVFTEVGYPSQDGCARDPWNYYGSDTVDLYEQYVCLQAFFETWRDEPAVHAICIWKWDGEGGMTDRNYTPKGKPAEQLLRRWILGGPLGDPPPIPPPPRTHTADDGFVRRNGGVDLNE